MPPAKYLVPNGFTAVSLVLGLWSTSLSAAGRFDLAAWMILWGTLLDKADGTAARLCKATSEFGVQFDSFADFVAFGIAPGALVYYAVQAAGLGAAAGSRTLLMLAVAIYVVALAIRLARFNISTGGETVFFGVPGTLMGALIAAGYLTFAKHHLPSSWLRYSPGLLVLGALLMVSTIRLPKLKVRKSLAMNVFQFSNVAAAYVVAPLMLFPEYLFGLAVAYLAGGTVWCLLEGGAAPTMPAPASTPEAEPDQTDGEEPSTEPAAES